MTTKEKREKAKEDDKKHKDKYNTLYRQKLKYKKRIDMLLKENQSLKKKVYRYKILSLTNDTENINPDQETSTPKKETNAFLEKLTISQNEKEEVKKVLFEKNVLCASMKSQYENADNTEKRIIKNILTNELVKKYKMVTTFQGILGLKGRIRVKAKCKKPSNMEKNIKNFYLQDDVSTATAGKKETKTLKKVKMQKRFLVDTMRNLHKKFEESMGQKVSYTTFIKNRPFYVISPTLSNRETCGCKKHANIEFKHTALKRLQVVTKDCTLNSLINSTVCDEKLQACMYKECPTCADKQISYDVSSTKLDDKVTWLEWDLKTVEYVKDGVKKTTKKMVKEIKSGTLRYLISEFIKELNSFKVHIFNITHNKYNKEIQAVHFGASHKQITLHTSVIYTKDRKPQCFCTFSGVNKHTPEAIWAHLKPILASLKEETPQLTTIHFFSDGPSSQYRQKKNFYLLTCQPTPLGYTSVTWNFFEAAHGKGAADGVGGAIKRLLDRKVAHGYDIPNAEIAFNSILNETSIRLFLINEPDIHLIEEDVKQCSLLPVPNTTKIHQIVDHDQPGTVGYRILSCYCEKSTRRGYCSCFSRKTHIILKDDVIVRPEGSNRRRKRAIVSSDSDSDDNGDVRMTKQPAVTILSNVKVNYKAEELAKMVKTAKSYNVSSANIQQDFRDLFSVNEAPK
ncbi:unnamed protein product [Plutella xylostella]|uniref:(diamondback moth) hypothetical protein n=1 Tax=Plutella xylostella TaxID=51655 RepID=A0A8S4G8W0_PLUXY|nr:unnamed protein product [Plutella xylostella]